MNTVRKFFGIIFICVAVVGIVSFAKTSEPQNLVATIFCLLVSFLLFKKNNKRISVEQNNKVDTVNNSKKYFFNLVSGLPAPQNTLTILEINETEVNIKCNNVEYSLLHTKITDVSVKTETDIQQQYVSSAGGAVAGALTFGVAGALVGGRTKKKKIKQTHSYLMISYLKEDAIDYILFDVTNLYFQSTKFIKEFNQFKTNINIQVQL